MKFSPYFVKLKDHLTFKTVSPKQSSKIKEVSGLICTVPTHIKENQLQRLRYPCKLSLVEIVHLK